MLLLCLLTHQQISSSLTLFFVRCEQHETTLKVKECMQQQWSDIIRPRCKAKTKIKVNLTCEVVEKSHYIANLSSNCMYFYTIATAKADVTLQRIQGVSVFNLTVSTSYYLLLYLLLHLCIGVLYIYIVIIISASFLSNLASLNTKFKSRKSLLHASLLTSCLYLYNNNSINRWHCTHTNSICSTLWRLVYNYMQLFTFSCHSQN